MLNRLIPPPSRSIDHIEITQATSEKLNNGIPLHLIQAGTQDVIRIEFIFRSGNWFETKKGFSFFTTKMLSEGTQKKTAHEITNYIDKYGAFLDLEPGVDHSTLTIYSLGKHLPSILPLLHEMMYESVFPESELEIVKNIKKQKINLNLKKNNIVASHKFREALFGTHHPYGRFIEADEVDSFDRKEITSFFRSHFLDNYEIILSGKITPEIIELINRYFGNHNYEPKVLKPEHLIQPGSKNIVVDRPDSLQSSIRIGRRLFKKSHPDFIKMKVVNEILGGYFGSRLMKNIREEKGYTYGISSSVLSLQHEGFFIIGTDVKKEFTDKTIQETYKEIDLLRNELVDAEEMNTVKNYMLGSFLASINNPFSLADKFKSIYLYDLGYGYFDQFIKTVKNIKAEEVREIANQYLSPDSLYEVIVGGKS